MSKLSFKHHLLYNIALGSMFLAFSLERFNRQETEKNLGDTRTLIKAMSQRSNKSFTTDNLGNTTMFTHVPSENFHYLLNDFLPLKDTKKHDNFNGESIVEKPYNPLNENGITEKINNAANIKFKIFQEAKIAKEQKKSVFEKISGLFNF